ncbi:flagellar hook basal-body protein [Sphingorhabdus sp. Alg239-R122]|uniref:flagellar hook-basal body protein n=1 Tax=Sphingorhabdus sp. Alg239-R122 TaxID=2305989 RepID=UPI0013DD5B4F|nr:flagellar hook basal-body protein [Sphingorhabdus sp. Alg239-R122]
MGEIIEIGSAILTATERKLETVSHNIANITTSGFKRQVPFAELLPPVDSNDSIRVQNTAHADMEQGKLRQTGNPLDLAISGSGFFMVGAGENMFFTRQGEFRLDADDRLVNSQGFAVQGMDGDIVLSSGRPEILEDGTVLEDGLPVAQIAIFSAEDGQSMRPVSGSLFAAPETVMMMAGNYVLRQGMVETSNVGLAEEMITMMAAIRQAEAGSKLVQVYDDLIGRAITTFGQGGR